MLTPRELSYLSSLSRVKNILRILSAFGFRQPALTRLLKKSWRVSANNKPIGRSLDRLDTDFSNIGGDTFCEIRELIPPDLAEELAKHDEIRTRLWKLFSARMEPGSEKRAKALFGCQQAHMVLLNAAPEIKAKACVIPYCCNSRMCPACSREKSRKTFSRIVDTIGPDFEFYTHRVMWVTLTIRNPPEGSLDQGIRDLLKGFRRLRRPKEMNGRRGLHWNCWTEKVEGYIWNLEVSHNMKARTWHPHIHIVFTGDFLPWQELKAEWLKALKPTGRAGDVKIGEAYFKDARGNKISAIDAPDGRYALDCLLEATKYTLKPFESDIPSSCIFELTDAVFRKRLFGSGGSWHLKPEQDRGAPAFWALEGGLAHCLEDVDGPWFDADYQYPIVQACSLNHPSWLRIVRAYQVFYWIQVSESEHSATE